MKIKLLSLIALFMLATPACASDIKIEGAWSRATAPGQEVGSVGMVITSPKDARLIAVSSTAAQSAEIHTMSMDNGVMKMRQLDYLALPANEPVKLGPGGDHLMLFGLKKPLKAGNKITVILTVQYADKKTEKIRVKADIRALTGEHQSGHQAH